MRLRHIKERFLAKVSVDPEEGCWNWTGTSVAAGYGKFVVKGKTTSPAHRVSYELFVGPIPDDLVIHHKCLNRKCVNPDHLEPLSRSENARLGRVGLRKLVCKRGHPRSGDNLYIAPSGTWSCRKCSALTGREYYLRRKAFLLESKHVQEDDHN